MFVAWSCFFGAAVIADLGSLAYLAVRLGVGPFALLPLYIYRQAHVYEKVEAAWQRKRLVAIAKCESVMPID